MQVKALPSAPPVREGSVGLSWAAMPARRWRPRLTAGPTGRELCEFGWQRHESQRRPNCYPCTDARTPLASPFNRRPNGPRSRAHTAGSATRTPCRPRHHPCTDARTPLASPFNRRPNGPRSRARHGWQRHKSQRRPSCYPCTDAPRRWRPRLNACPTGRAVRTRLAAPRISAPSQLLSVYRCAHAVGVAV